MIEEILRYNEEFTAQKRYLPYKTGNYPRKKLAILACMDARLIELLPAALGLRNGDVKMVKNAGGMVLDSQDSVIRSLLIAVLELKAEEIMVIAHTDCGVKGMEPSDMREHLHNRGVTEEAIADFEASGLTLDHWFCGFSTSEASVVRSLHILRDHPLMPADIIIRGFVMDVVTGRLTPVQA